jgi:hypothetical protein
MADTKISELPVATAIASPDVVPIVQGGTTKKANVNLFVGSFLSSNIARVDPTGSDSTGSVGDLNKPFLTVQGAIDAIEAGSFSNPTIDVGDNSFTEDVTTSLQLLMFLGAGLNSTPYNSLTCTEPTNQVSIFLTHVAANSGAISAASAAGISVEIISSLVGDITNSAGPITLFCFGNPELQGNISAPGFAININGPSTNYTPVMIDSAGSAVTVKNCVVSLNAAASITLVDSRLVYNNAGITPTYADVLLANPIFPDSDPHIAGAGYWVAGALVKSIG